MKDADDDVKMKRFFEIERNFLDVKVIFFCLSPDRSDDSIYYYIYYFERKKKPTRK